MINPEKPRKGYFEVRFGGVVVTSLPAMPRPFNKLREADMGDLAAAVVTAAKGSAPAVAAAASSAAAPPSESAAVTAAPPSKKKARK